MNGLTITGTGTGVGKTFFTRGLARALLREGHAVAAIKPYETGCALRPADAEALARACSDPSLAHAPGLYRATLPLAPFSASLRGEPPPPPIDDLAARVRELAGPARAVLVEGAGGLFVPLSTSETFADFAAHLGFPLLLVASNRLGTLSHVLATVRAARAHALAIRAVVLVDSTTDPDESATTNARALEPHLPGIAIARFPICSDEDDALAGAVAASPLFSTLKATLGIAKDT